MGIFFLFVEDYIGQVKMLSLKSYVKADVFISRGCKEMRARLTTLKRTDNMDKKSFCFP